ncbi:MAG: glycosyltransferase, partial [Candidatus Gracilibacteria bacterium]
MLKMYPEVKGKISTIHNGIDLQQFDQSIIRFSTQAKDKIREQIFQADHDDFIILTIAELHPRKGLNYLIEAFKTIQEQKPKTKLVIVGKGPQKAKLEKLIKKLELSDSVVLAGHQDDIPQILKSANLFVLPSVKEAFGLVLLEAMAAQLPIIATEVGGIPEIVQN